MQILNDHMKPIRKVFKSCKVPVIKIRMIIKLKATLAMRNLTNVTGLFQTPGICI
jgi:hypothetical protein